MYADGLQIINQGNALFSYLTHLNIISFLCNLLMFFVVLAIQSLARASETVGFSIMLRPTMPRLPVNKILFINNFFFLTIDGTWYFVSMLIQYHFTLSSL